MSDDAPYLEPALAALWRGQDPFAAAFALTGELRRSGPGRRTLRVRLGDADYYAKLHSGVGWREVLKNWLSLRAPVVDGRNEFAAARVLAGAGVKALRVAAFGARGRSPAHRQSFVVSHAIAAEASLEDVARRWRSAPPPAAARRRLVVSLARLARDVHAAGIAHRDFYLCHVLQAADGLHVIDLHRALAFSTLPRRWRVKDLAGLYFSALDARLSRRDVLAFVRHYAGALPRTRAERRLWRDVVARARRLYRRETARGNAAGDATILEA